MSIFHLLFVSPYFCPSFYIELALIRNPNPLVQITELAGYTQRVAYMIEVFRDVQSGHYVRECMAISSSNHPRSHRHALQLRKDPSLLSKRGWQDPMLEFRLIII